MKKGGAAKGELVMAIFELGNCFRHGWGIKKDFVAARQVSLDETMPQYRQSTHKANVSPLVLRNGSKPRR
ncbi:hypothetical protein J3459_007404 [Metarhizium acridum]|nr:hypothetical protein J3459_007404 [Metarhizium acridum]